eukprot:2205153-Rhodomonas_salina.3
MFKFKLQPRRGAPACTRGTVGTACTKIVGIATLRWRRTPSRTVTVTGVPWYAYSRTQLFVLPTFTRAHGSGSAVNSPDTSESQHRLACKDTRVA